jgi:hypothetical protein
MRKIVEIGSCTECGYYIYCELWDYFTCRLSNHEYDGQGCGIPDECPLPNAPQEGLNDLGMTINEAIKAIGRSMDVKTEHLVELYGDILKEMDRIKNAKQEG